MYSKIWESSTTERNWRTDRDNDWQTYSHTDWARLPQSHVGRQGQWCRRSLKHLDRGQKSSIMPRTYYLRWRTIIALPLTRLRSYKRFCSHFFIGIEAASLQGITLAGLDIRSIEGQRYIQMASLTRFQWPIRVHSKFPTAFLKVEYLYHYYLDK